MRRKKPVLVGDLLSLFIKEFGLEKGYRDYCFLKIWNEIMSEGIIKATLNKRLDNRKLYIYLSSSVVRDELFMMRSDIINEFNRRAGEKIIDELILK
jgi:hypothetical protein